MILLDAILRLYRALRYVPDRITHEIELFFWTVVSFVIVFGLIMGYSHA